jgi:hypothetical protein
MDDPWLRYLHNHALDQPVFVRVLRDGPNHLLVVASSNDVNIKSFGGRRTNEAPHDRSPTENLLAATSLAGADHDLGDLFVPGELDQRSDRVVAV